VTARFSVPRYAEDDAFDMVDFVRSGHVYRVDGVNNALRRVVLQFTEPLPFEPGAQRTFFHEAADEPFDPASL
jgi:hypothetical protein